MKEIHFICFYCVLSKNCLYYLLFRVLNFSAKLCIPRIKNQLILWNSFINNNDFCIFLVSLEFSMQYLYCSWSWIIYFDSYSNFWRYSWLRKNNKTYYFSNYFFNYNFYLPWHAGIKFIIIINFKWKKYRIIKCMA